MKTLLSLLALCSFIMFYRGGLPQFFYLQILFTACLHILINRDTIEITLMMIYLRIRHWWTVRRETQRFKRRLERIAQEDLAIEIINGSRSRNTYFPMDDSNFDQVALDFTMRLQKSHWMSNEIDLSRSLGDWNNRLDSSIRQVYKQIFAFFALGDGVVLDVLSSITEEVNAPEINGFYSTQSANEVVHAQSYGLIIKDLFPNPDEAREMLEILPLVPPLSSKIDWVNKWGNPSHPFSVRIMVGLIMEQLWFSCAFNAINILRKFNLMESIVLLNDFVIADETLHRDFAVHILKKYAPLIGDRLEIFDEMAKEAYAAELEVVQFVSTSTEAISEEKFPTNEEGSMKKYLSFEYQSNALQNVFNIMYTELGLEIPFQGIPILNDQNILTVAAREKHNFFDRDSSSYRKPSNCKVSYEML